VRIVIVSTRPGAIPWNPIESAVFASKKNRGEKRAVCLKISLDRREVVGVLSLRISSLHYPGIPMPRQLML